MSFYVTRFFSKSCKILMFYSFKAFNDRQFHLKVRLTNGKNVLKSDNGIRSKEFQLQKYLFDHYMIWKIDCFLFTSLWSTNKTYFWKLPLPTTSLSLPRLLLLYWLSSFSNKNQTVSINNFFSWRKNFSKLYLCNNRSSERITRCVGGMVENIHDILRWPPLLLLAFNGKRWEIQLHSHDDEDERETLYQRWASRYLNDWDCCRL